MRYSVCLVLLFLFCAELAFSQALNRDVKIGYPCSAEAGLSGYRWEIYLTPLVNESAIIKHDAGAPMILKSAPQISGEAGVNRIIPIDQSYQLVVGLHYRLVGRNGSYQVPGPELGRPANQTYDFSGGMAQEHDVSVIAVPILAERMFFLRNCSAYFLRIGPSIELSTGGSSSNSDMHLMTISIQANRQPLLFGNIIFGFARALKNNQYLRFGIAGHFGNARLAKGSFSLRTINLFDSGSYDVGGNNVGLVFTYTFGARAH